MSFPQTPDPRLLAAAEAAGLEVTPMLGGVLLHANSHHVTLDTEGGLLTYDNNGRFVRDASPRVAPTGDDLVALLRQVSAKPPVRPQVRVGLR